VEKDENVEKLVNQWRFARRTDAEMDSSMPAHQAEHDEFIKAGLELLDHVQAVITYAPCPGSVESLLDALDRLVVMAKTTVMMLEVLRQARQSGAAPSDDSTPLPNIWGGLFGPDGGLRIQ